jgi:anti-anti-sigma factor
VTSTVPGVSPDDELSGLFAGGGRLGEVMASRDWSATPVGRPDQWPPALRQVVRIMLASRFSMWVGWGPELAFFYNDAYQRDTLQSKHPWALGRPAREVWAEIWDDIEPRIASVRRTGQATWDEGLLLFLERAGYTEETYHTFSYSPLRGEDGDVAGFLCVVSEDTQRVLGERRLRVLSELAEFAATADPTPESACAATVEVLRRHRLDIPFAAIYLVESGGARRSGWFGIVDDDAIVPAAMTRESHPDASIWEAVDTSRPVLLDDLRARCGDGFVAMPTPMPARTPDAAVAVPLLGSGGEALGVLFAGISPFRAFDEEYRRFVELVAGQAGAAIAAAQAYQVQRRRAEELAELDRAKSAFFAGVSHELRTPLTLIGGPAEDALADVEAPLPAPQRARVEVIARNSGRLRRLVDTLLEFGRLEAGRLVPERVAVDLAELTCSIAESFAPAIARAGLENRIDCAPLPTAVAVDVDMWEKIVLNLLSNALKYTLDGSVHLALAPTPDGGVELTVRDTGIGIPDDEQPRLFERFHRVRGARGRSHEGSGIGLALVAELAALHGGTVHVTSAPGEGSTFGVVLPPSALTGDTAVRAGASVSAALYRDEALQWSPDPDGDPPVEPDAIAPFPVGPGARVLVAEDNQDLRGFLTGLLARQYTVLTAADGTAALDLARTERPDLILTDVMMPGLDGFALVTALRADPSTATIPVIMLSARAGVEAAAEGLGSGADDYLVKPFSSHDLLARIRSNLAMARLRNHEGAWRTALVNALQDGLFVIDSTGRVVEINDAFTEVLGYGQDGLPYALPHPWWPDPDADPDGYADVAAALSAAREGGGGRFLLPLRHRDGHRLWASCSAAAIPDPEGAGPMIVGVLRDVTTEHRTAQRDRLLAEAGELIAAPGSLAGRLDRLAELTAATFADLVLVALSEPDGSLRPAAAAHRTDPDAAARARLRPHLRLPESPAASLRSGQAFVAEAGHDLVPDTPDGARTLVVPLTAAGRLLGALVLTDAPGSPDPVDRQTAQELGRRIAVAVESDRIAAREQHLHSVTAALAAAATVAEVSRVLATSVHAMLGTVGVAVYVQLPDDEGHLHLAHVLGEEAQVGATAGTLSVSTDHPVARAARDRAPMWPAGGADGARAQAALPLVIGRRTVGVLALRFATERLVPPDERGFAATLGGQAALALDRATIADTRWEIAQTLQVGLLPARLPALARVALDARYRPAGQYAAAGGDWYDVTVLDEDHIAIAVGDVVGHGAAAAAVMGQLRAALAAYLLEDHSPARALELLSRFAAQIEGARGSTAICLVLDTATGDLRWARAGHLPPLIVAADGSTCYLDDTQGAILGLAGTPPITEGTTVLAPGAGVLLYTDGLVERRGEVVDEGLDRLACALASHARTPVDQLLPAVLDDALDGTGPRDDVAAVMARLRPPALVGARPAVPVQLTAVRHEVGAWAGLAMLPVELVDDLQLALGEALANSVEHAYPGPAGEMRYRLELRADGGLDVTAADDGIWRPTPDDPGYRGHGLRSIRALTENLRVEHTAGGTTLRFTVPAARGVEPVPQQVATPPPTAARLRIDRDGTGLRVRLSGELDLATVPGIRTALLAAVTGSTGPVEIDAVEVTYLSSAGIALILDARQAAGGPVRVRAAASGAAPRILRLAGLLS